MPFIAAGYFAQAFSLRICDRGLVIEFVYECRALIVFLGCTLLLLNIPCLYHYRLLQSIQLKESGDRRALDEARLQPP